MSFKASRPFSAISQGMFRPLSNMDNILLFEGVSKKRSQRDGRKLLSFSFGQLVIFGVKRKKEEEGEEEEDVEVEEEKELEGRRRTERRCSDVIKE